MQFNTQKHNYAFGEKQIYINLLMSNIKKLKLLYLAKLMQQEMKCNEILNTIITRST